MHFFRKKITINDLIDLTFVLFENRYQNINTYLNELNTSYSNNFLIIITFYYNVFIIKELLKQVYPDEKLANNYFKMCEQKFIDSYIISNNKEILNYIEFLKDDLNELLNDFSNSDLEKLTKYFINEIEITEYDNNFFSIVETIILSWKNKSKFIIEDFSIKSTKN